MFNKKEFDFFFLGIRIKLSNLKKGNLSPEQVRAIGFKLTCSLDFMLTWRLPYSKNYFLNKIKYPPHPSFICWGGGGFVCLFLF